MTTNDHYNLIYGDSHRHKIVYATEYHDRVDLDRDNNKQTVSSLVFPAVTIVAAGMYFWFLVKLSETL